MDKLKNQLKDLLEVEVLDISKKFVEFDEWDSLTSISIIALLDSDYNISMTNDGLLEFSNIGEFCEFVANRAK
jgi:acyl carrier protein